jgi:hypothetical protein
MSRRLSATFAVVLALSPAAGAPKLREKPAPDLFFPTTVGTTWVYQDGTAELTEVITKVDHRPDGAVVSVGRIQGWKVVPLRRLLVTRRTLYEVADRKGPYDTPWCIFKVHAAAGDTWLMVDPGPAVVGIDIHCEARPPIELVLPFCQCSAVGVRWVAEIKGANHTWTAATYWFAKGMGVVLVETSGSPRVLKAFFPNK